MKKLRSVNEIEFDFDVILRLDTDLPIGNGKVLDNSRLLKSISTIKLLLERNCRMVIVGHRGRPEGKDESLSLKPVYTELMSLLEKDRQNWVESVFIEDLKKTKEIERAIESNQIIFVENLRFYKEEELGDTSIFGDLKNVCSVFVNDAFAVAHRENASIMLFKEMETFYGLSFVEEVEKIGNILDIKEKPMTIVLGGAKEDKLKYLEELSKKADYVLVGGKLPKLIKTLRHSGNSFDRAANIIVANLRDDGLDLSDEDIKKFKKIINESKIIVWAGAMGFYEKDDCQKGTEEIAKAIADSKAYKIIAGGDTGASIVSLGLKDKIDYVCSGGGVMLEFLTKGTLPSW